jgi:IS30 family transposase
MLSQSQRATILELHANGMNKREIAKLLNLSRQSVRKVLQANSIAVPKIEREEKAAPYRQQILELFHTCKGNLVRVHGAKAKKSCWPMARRCRIKR